MGASRIMVIRHAEKPARYQGVRYRGVTAKGKKDPESLVTLGWERAGALVTLFALPWGPAGPALAAPNFLFAADPSKKNRPKGKVRKRKKDSDGDGPSKRPWQTIRAVAAKLELPIDRQFAKDDYPSMVSAALACNGIVLIAWQHQDIPWENADGDPGISQCLLNETRTPFEQFEIPVQWPEDRYDLVWVFDRPEGKGPITAFSQFPQRLLAGDGDFVLRT